MDVQGLGKDTSPASGKKLAVSVPPGRKPKVKGTTARKVTKTPIVKRKLKLDPKKKIVKAGGKLDIKKKIAKAIGKLDSKKKIATAGGKKSIKKLTVQVKKETLKSKKSKTGGMTMIIRDENTGECLTYTDPNSSLNDVLM